MLAYSLVSIVKSVATVWWWCSVTDRQRAKHCAQKRGNVTKVCPMLYSVMFHVCVSGGRLANLGSIVRGSRGRLYICMIRGVGARIRIDMLCFKHWYIVMLMRGLRVSVVCVWVKRRTSQYREGNHEETGKLSLSLVSERTYAWRWSEWGMIASQHSMRYDSKSTYNHSKPCWC